MGIMRVIPVLDLQAGLVVRGVGGRRQEYRPVVSKLTRSCHPLDVAQAFREQLDMTLLYLADLDAIAGAAPAAATYQTLCRHGFRLWIDAGIRRAPLSPALQDCGIEGIVAGLETLAKPQVLAQLCRDHGDRIIFSLDLQSGTPLGNTTWTARDALGIAGEAMAQGRVACWFSTWPVSVRPAVRPLPPFVPGLDGLIPRRPWRPAAAYAT